MDLVNGSSLLDVLQQVNHSPNRMADQLSRAIGNSVESGAIDEKTGQDILHFFDLVKNRYTYLDPGETKTRAGQPPAWHVPPRNRNVRPFK